MIIKSLNQRLGPKTITAEGQVQKISEIVKKKTGKEYKEIRREVPKRVKKRGRKYPMRKNCEEMEPKFISQKEVLKMHEKNIHLLDKALSKIKNEDIIKHIVKEKKESQKVYKPFKVKKYKKRPLTRLERNMMLFTEIFIEPERRRIEKLKEKEKDFTNLVKNVVNEQYNKILNYDFKKNKAKKEKLKLSGRKKRPLSSISKITAAITNIKERTRNLRLLSATTKRHRKKTKLLNSKPVRNIQSAYPGSRLAKKATYKQKNFERKIDQFLNDSRVNEEEEEQEQSESGVDNEEFFDMPIFLQLPDLPNSTVASTLTPGQGWAPSLPLLSRLEFTPKELKDLMLRARSGLKIGDHQKEAHLLFYLGIVSENKKEYKKSCSYFKRFFKFAKSMQDKVGMAFALNRIGIGFYFLEKYDVSLKYNKNCLEMIDNDNEYSVLYNIGICFRKMKDFFESLKFFEKALIWAKTREDTESECLIYGQMALTSHKSGDEERALMYYNRCKDLSSQVKNLKLELDCLIKALDIRETISVRTKKTSLAPRIEDYYEALEAAESVNDMGIKRKCKINMGVIQGEKRYHKFSQKLQRELKAGRIRKLEEEMDEDEDIITEYI